MSRNIVEIEINSDRKVSDVMTVSTAEIIKIIGIACLRLIIL